MRTVSRMTESGACTMPPVASAVMALPTGPNADAFSTIRSVENGRSLPFMCVPCETSKSSKTIPKRRRNKQPRRSRRSAENRGGLSRSKFKLLNKARASRQPCESDISVGDDEFPRLSETDASPAPQVQWPSWTAPPTRAANGLRIRPLRLVLLNVRAQMKTKTRIVCESVKQPGARFPSLRTRVSRDRPELVITRQGRPVVPASAEGTIVLSARLKPRRVVAPKSKKTVIGNARIVLARRSALALSSTSQQSKSRRSPALFPGAKMSARKAGKLGFTPEWNRLRRHRLYSCLFNRVRQQAVDPNQE